MIILRARLKKLKTFEIPVEWSLINSVFVEAETLEEAIDIVENLEDLPTEDSMYVDDSFSVNTELADLINNVKVKTNKSKENIIDDFKPAELEENKLEEAFDKIESMSKKYIQEE